MKISLFAVLLVSATPVCLSAQSVPPRIFFSDLESGPNIGGKSNHGVFVTIWGRGFGAERGRSIVTIGGGAASNYPVWSDNKITFQLGPAARTGDMIVKVAGLASNGLPFTVRRGRIFFVATDGSDRHNGSFATPWRSILHAKDHMSAGRRDLH